MKAIEKIIFSLLLCFIGISILSAQDNLDILYTLDTGLLPSGLNIDRVGQNVSVLGDINGDGYDDWATVSGVEYETGTGSNSVQIFLGGPIRRASETLADIIIYNNEIQSFGPAYKAGDVNADGFDDILIYGGWTDEDSGEFDSGWYLFYGGNPFNTEADVLFQKLDYHAGSANFASDAGDVNNDGFDDILLSVPTVINGTDTAHVYLFYGAENIDNIPDIIFSSTVEYTNSGPIAYNFTGATAAGDMNNDGFGDIIISNHIVAKVYFGGTNMDNKEDVIFDDFRGGGTGTGPGVGDAGDVNGDGFDDVLMTANIGTAKAIICFGGSVVDNIPDVVIPMWKEDSYPGFSATMLGDLNNDGYDDILLGTRTYYTLALGQARVFYGGAEMDSIADISLDATQGYTVFGHTVAGDGDFNGDGFPDFLVGDIGNASSLNKHDDAGSISLFYGGINVSGNADAVFSGSADREGFGSAVAGAGDVNGDGYQDIIVGASNHWEAPYHYAGRAYLYFGGTSRKNEADLVFNSTFKYNGNHAYFGKEVGSAGDVNGDGFDDIYVVEQFKASIFLGGTQMDTIADYVFNMQVNDFSFSAVGDVNKDGYDDILYSKPTQNLAGKAYLYFGGENLLDGVDITFTGLKAGDNFGQISHAAGDVNGDGYADFIIAVPGDDSNGTNLGAVQLFLGAENIPTTPALTFNGTAADPFSYNFAFHINGGKDINNDGFDDIAVSNGLFSLTPGSNEGRIYFFYGGVQMDNTADRVLTGSSPKNYLGLRRISFLPDLNKDGFDEIFTSEGNYQSGGDDREKPVIFYGGTPMDSLSDITLPYSSANMDIGYFFDNQDSSVHLLAGDPVNRAAGPSMGRVFVYSGNMTGIEDTQTADHSVADFSLYQNYPNPFNPKTVISYQLAENKPVKLSIYNVLGQEVATLISGKQSAGHHQVTWDASAFPSGLYFYRLKTENHTEVRKMMLLR